MDASTPFKWPRCAAEMILLNPAWDAEYEQNLAPK